MVGIHPARDRKRGHVPTILMAWRLKVTQRLFRSRMHDALCESTKQLELAQRHGVQNRIASAKFYLGLSTVEVGDTEHGAKLMREGFERWWAVMGTNLVNEIGTRAADALLRAGSVEFARAKSRTASPFRPPATIVCARPSWSDSRAGSMNWMPITGRRDANTSMRWASPIARARSCLNSVPRRRSRPCLAAPGCGTKPRRCSIPSTPDSRKDSTSRISSPPAAASKSCALEKPLCRQCQGDTLDLDTKSLRQPSDSKSLEPQLHHPRQAKGSLSCQGQGCIFLVGKQIPAGALRSFNLAVMGKCHRQGAMRHGNLRSAFNGTLSPMYGFWESVLRKWQFAMPARIV